MFRQVGLQGAPTSESSTLDWHRANMTSALFHRMFVRVDTLGQGGDGIVESYRNCYTKNMVAVKSPLNASAYHQQSIRTEIRKLKKVGNHDHVVRFLSVCPDFQDCPAIILQYCDLGSVTKYREDFCDNERRFGRLPAMPELTVLKLFRDVSLALDHIHNRLDTRYVHSDLKPDNILVLTPPGHNQRTGFPLEPIFKITDFARLIAFPGTRARHWEGTPEYGPPLSEQFPVEPSADIWSLGCTIQSFALGIHPTMSREAFIDARLKVGLTYPSIHADREVWRSSEWRHLRSTRYRPINVPAEILYQRWDVKQYLDYQPYSVFLNYWYMSLMDPNPQRRFTAEHLAKNIVPMIERRMEVLKSLERAREYSNMATEISADGSFPPRGIRFDDVDGKLSTKWI